MVDLQNVFFSASWASVDEGRSQTSRGPWRLEASAARRRASSSAPPIPSRSRRPKSPSHAPRALRARARVCGARSWPPPSPPRRKHPKNTLKIWWSYGKHLSARRLAPFRRCLQLGFRHCVGKVVLVHANSEAGGFWTYILFGFPFKGSS